MRPDFRNFKGFGLLALAHSAKGTEWKKHKYIKKINGTYYYPDDYKGGRHLPSSNSNNNGSSSNNRTFEDFYKADDETASAMIDEIIKSKTTSSTFSSAEKKATLLKLQDMSGMRLSALSALYDLSRDEGYNSEDFKIMLDVLSEGDPDEAKKMVTVLKQGSTSKGSTKGTSSSQSRVNGLMSESTGSTKVSSINSSGSSKKSTGLDYETIFSVYRKKK